MELEITLSIIGSLLVIVAVLIPVFKTVAPIYPYAYTNARLRAMRNALLKKEDYDELIKKPYAEIIYALGRKSFPDVSAQIGVDTTFATVESAFRTHLITALEKVHKISPQQTQPFIKAFLSKYDIQLLQSLVRSTTNKYPFKRDIYHRSTLFSQDLLTKDHPTIDDIYNQLKKTAYEPILAKHLDDLKKKQFKAFEEELDLLYFRRLMRSAKTKESRTYVKMIIDRYNISLLLKKETALIPQGKIPLKELQDLKTPHDITKKIKKFGYEVTQEKPELIERDLTLLFKKKGESMLSANPLSEATIIGFMILLTTNIRAITLLLKLKYHDFDEQTIREVGTI